MADEIILIESDTESEDEDLRQAIALSLQELSNEEASKEQTGEDPEKPNKIVSSMSCFGSLVLDRKKMEQDRLSRRGKRTLSSEHTDHPHKRQTPSHPREPALKFPKGEVRRTWARGFPENQETIRIEDVLQKDDLQLAILSSFTWDEEWLLSKINVRQTKMLLVAFSSDQTSMDAMKSNAPPNVKFCFPKMNGPGAMHSKLQILKFSTHIRIVIPTGNLVPYDWGETGVMENMVFLIDLPRLIEEAVHCPNTFSQDLSRFLRLAGVDDQMVTSLSKYDFSAASDLGFVYTVPGGHTGGSLRQVGYSSLGQKVTSLGLATSNPVEVDLLCSSLGSINEDLLVAIYNACQGDDGLKEYNSRINRKSKPDNGISTQLKTHFRIYFPSSTTVKSSRGGPQGGGTICLQSKWWRAPTFPRNNVRDCINTRRGVLLHSKAIFVRSMSTDKPICWAYVGSANLSESAWGRIVPDKTTQSPKITCRNWECGVIIPVRDSSASKVADMGIFQGKIPVPMETPGPEYSTNDGPWFFQDNQSST